MTSANYSDTLSYGGSDNEETYTKDISSLFHIDEKDIPFSLKPVLRERPVGLLFL